MKSSVFSRLFAGFGIGLFVLGAFSSAAFAAPFAAATALPKGDEIVIYVGDGCPHCAKVEEHVEDEGYMDVFNLEFKEVYHDSDNATEFGEVAEFFGIPLFDRGVPFLATSSEHFVGDKPIIEFLDDKYDAWLIANAGVVGDVDGDLDSGGSSGSGGPEDGFDPNVSDSARQLTIPLLIGAALVDAVNPCAFAVLIILLTTILAGGVKKRALYSGLLFSFAVFLSYLAMGLGLYSAITSVGISLMFMKVVGVLAILLGLFNLKDVFFYGKGFVMEVPMKWRPKMKAILRSVTSPAGAFVIGFLISLFLLPCTSGPYIVIISLLGQQDMFWHALRLLVLYNVIFVAPMVFITLAVYKGFSVERAEEIRQKRLKVLHLIAGVILIVMGVVILMGYA
ncbi:cytochrome c biogenesis protein [Candidatus Peregrinibacteria bacterium]|nr:cytochrome c biogenesis protein [Candidatus Peregrinibacteria bacterium]MBT4147734.1 cytochrome c biogenesis protein [Candidatus Peregrinibacteria bacterium]MBT4455721.1 cytochrome c biogenesis protein [Candidatus Peregrinibacteria bacterium]